MGQTRSARSPSDTAASRWSKRVAILVGVLAGGALAVYVAVTALTPMLLPPAHSDYVPRDPALRSRSLYFYVPHGTEPRARVLVFFFGNDVGFWAAHQQLAADLASHGYDVVGYDVKPLIDSLPRGGTVAAAAQREAIFTTRLADLIRASRRELGADTLPLVLVGHSFGAELAVWTASQLSLPRLRGVVAIAPAPRGHLAITAADLANIGDPREPGSFSVAATVATLPRSMRIALLRGGHDRLARADSAIIRAGGSRLRYWVIPLAGHSLRNVLVARYAVRDAVAWAARPF